MIIFHAHFLCPCILSKLSARTCRLVICVLFYSSKRHCWSNIPLFCTYDANSLERKTKNITACISNELFWWRIRCQTTVIIQSTEDCNPCLLNFSSFQQVPIRELFLDAVLSNSAGKELIHLCRNGYKLKRTSRPFHWVVVIWRTRKYRACFRGLCHTFTWKFMLCVSIKKSIWLCSLSANPCKKIVAVI